MPAWTGIELPAPEPGPVRRIARRVAIAVALIVWVALLAYIGRDGYEDPVDGEISLLDAFYYATVSITTTGYGDITPVSDGARLVTTVLVTPARVLFLILLVGTTLEILAERTRTAYRVSRWRSKLNEHTIICGYGTKGKSAARTMVARGTSPEQIVVIDNRESARRSATDAGHAAVAGNASAQEVLEKAGVREASSVVVAVDRDDTAVLVSLTARELNPDVTIAAAVREEENVHLLHQSGANSVVTSSGAAGRLLGISTEAPGVTEVLEDLLTVGEGLDIEERRIRPDEAGPISELRGVAPVVAVLRDGELLRFDDERVAELRAGDCVIELRSHRR